MNFENDDHHSQCRVNDVMPVTYDQRRKVRDRFGFDRKGEVRCHGERGVSRVWGIDEAVA